MGTITKMVFVTLCADCKRAEQHPKIEDAIKCTGIFHRRVLPKDFYCRCGQPKEANDHEDEK